MLKFIEGVFLLAKTLLILVSTVVIVVTAYILLTNPEVNVHLRRAEEPYRFFEWNYDLSSDVDAEPKYPIVVLRTGFKTIRVTSGRGLVGWMFEMINTSPKQPYSVVVDFTLEDWDSFPVASGTAETVVRPNSYGVAKGTIDVDEIDVGRLSGSNWTIRLAPNWESAEASTKETRYSRLASILKENVPRLWLIQNAADELSRLAKVNDKWAAIGEALGDEWDKPPEKPSFDDKELDYILEGTGSNEMSGEGQQ